MMESRAGGLVPPKVPALASRLRFGTQSRAVFVRGLSPTEFVSGWYMMRRTAILLVINAAIALCAENPSVSSQDTINRLAASIYTGPSVTTLRGSNRIVLRGACPRLAIALCSTLTTALATPRVGRLRLRRDPSQIERHVRQGRCA